MIYFQSLHNGASDIFNKYYLVKRAAYTLKLEINTLELKH